MKVVHFQRSLGEFGRRPAQGINSSRTARWSCCFPPPLPPLVRLLPLCRLRIWKWVGSSSSRSTGRCSYRSGSRRGPEWKLSRSTIAQPCNYSGWFSPKLAAQFGIISFDWANNENSWRLGKLREHDHYLHRWNRLALNFRSMYGRNSGETKIAEQVSEHGKHTVRV